MWKGKEEILNKPIFGAGATGHQFLRSRHAKQAQLPLSPKPEQSLLFSSLSLSLSSSPFCTRSTYDKASIPTSRLTTLVTPHRPDWEESRFKAELPTQPNGYLLDREAPCSCRRYVLQPSRIQYLLHCRHFITWQQCTEQ